MLLALSALIFLSACVTAEERLGAAGRMKAEADLVDTAIRALRPLPDMPADCTAREASGVRKGDRLDVALVKTDRALGRANARVRRCATWYGELKANPADGEMAGG